MNPAVAVGNGSAGAGRRVAAFVIDNIVFGIPLSILNGVLFKSNIMMGQALGAVIATIYFTVFWSSIGGGRSVGARVMGIRVVGIENGETLSLGRAFLRNIGLTVSMLVAMVGVIWALFDAQGQGWHDKIAKTRVIRS